MSNEELIELSYVQLSTIEEMLKEKYSDKYYTKLHLADTISCFYAEDFMLTFSYEDLVYYLSFCVDRRGYIVSEITMLILSVIEPENIHVVADHYYDHNAKELVYGPAANDARQRDILFLKGQQICLACERIVEREHIVKNGFCETCHSMKDQIRWN